MTRLGLIVLSLLSCYGLGVYSMPAPGAIVKARAPNSTPFVMYTLEDGDSCDVFADSSDQANSGVPSCTYKGPEPPLTSEGFCTCDDKSTRPLTSIPGTPILESESCKFDYHDKYER